MHPVLAEILENGPVITDGGWGTQLQLRGLKPGEHPDPWNLSNSEKVLEVAQAYVDAGSQVILTNTFGANCFSLERLNLLDELAEINKRGVEISKQAAGEKAKVFASMGPSGRMILAGNVTEDELHNAFKAQADAFLLGGADGIVIETMSDPQEACIATKAAKTTGLPIVVSMTFDSGKNKDRTMMGTTPEQAVELLTAAGADVIGSNCGQGIEGYLTICSRMKAVTELPIWIKANAGLPELIDGKTFYRQSPQEFAEKAMQLIEFGASFIGGCCGTSPDFIRAIREQMSS